MEGITIDWWPIAAVGFLVALDVITGLLKGWATHTLSSKVMREGLVHKATYALMIVLFVGVEILQQHFVVWPDFPTVSVICGYICVCEIISFFENLIAIYPDLADWPIIDKILTHEMER